MTDDPDAEILLETTVIGGAQQVRAVSGADGLEVSFQAPARASRGEVERLARAKLAFVRRAGGQSTDQASTRGSGGGRGGIVA